MSYTFLEQPRLKLARADQHIAEVKRVIDAYKEQAPARLVFDNTREPGNIVMYAKTDIAPPVGLPLVVGDAIHNMRAALDILACDLVDRAGHPVTKKVMFPFAKDDPSLQTEIKNKGLLVLSPDELAKIKQAKPYTGGNDILRSIHDLDIEDKHKFLVTSVTTTMAQKIDGYFIGGEHVIENIGGLITKEGVGMLRYPASWGDFYLTVQPNVLVDFVLEQCPIKNKNLVEQLQAMRDCAAQVVESF